MPLERSGSKDCVDEELIVLATFLETERRHKVKRPPATASAMNVVPMATPTMAPVGIEFETIAAAVCEAELVELVVEVAVGDAVTVLVTTALTRSKEVEFASPRVDELFCFTQPREMK